MEQTVYLVRHGAINCGNKKRYIGITDLHLNNVGLEHARILKKFFSTMVFEKVLISPLQRCIETANIILENFDIHPTKVKEFQEINMGNWENQTFEFIKNQFPNLYEERGLNIANFIPPGGESFYQLQTRVLPAFQHHMENTSGNILIIAHAGVNRVILSKVLDFPLENIFDINQPYGCVNKLKKNTKNETWQYCRVI
jgi:probable phosphoglycerate mutase